jgi:hypothetical protein
LEYSGDIGERMKTNLDRLPESDRIVLTKLFGLGRTRYGEIISNILPDIISEWGESGKERYLEVKLESMKKAMKQLWVELAGKTETFKIFNEFETFEEILFRSNSRRANYEYRGHYVHQFDVFLIGYYLLNRLLEENTTAARIFQGKSRNPNFTWLLAGTFHDMGYPIERIDYWFSDILNVFLGVVTQYQVEVEKIFPPIFSKYIEILSGWNYNPEVLTSLSNTQLLRDWSFYNILETNLRKKNHGVISSLLLMHSLLTKEKIAQSPTWIMETFPTEVLPACHAIALHGLESEGFIVSFGEHPYAFLLMLCDAVQDWQRSIDSEDHSELKAIDFSISAKVPKIEFSLDIQNENKIRELDELAKKLKTDGLLEVEIRQYNGDKLWKLC